jgi:hypothetical protein
MKKHVQLLKFPRRLITGKNLRSIQLSNKKNIRNIMFKNEWSKVLEKD